MDQNPPVLAKKVWSLMRIFFLTFKKTISKTRLFADLNMLMKRSKLAGKTLQNLLFHHHRSWAAATTLRHPHHLPFSTPPPSDDEFSCTTTPQHPFSYQITTPKHRQTHAPPSVINNDHEIVVDPAVIKAVEMAATVAVSPEFWKSPVVKPLRVTDSPFPVSDGDDGGQVDEAAERFILRFYSGLRGEN